MEHNPGSEEKISQVVSKIVERVLSLEKDNLHSIQPHLVKDVLSIIKEEAQN